MTPEDRLKRIAPSHDHFELILDPFHPQAIVTASPAVREAVQEGRVTNLDGDPPARNRFETQKKVWASIDWVGNVIGIWGEDMPPNSILVLQEDFTRMAARASCASSLSHHLETAAAVLHSAHDRVRSFRTCDEHVCVERRKAIEAYTKTTV